MKKLFTLLLAVAASIGTMFAWDYERVQIGDLYYNLDATNQTAQVTSQFIMDGNNYKGLTSANIPASVTYNSVTYSVTSIGEIAFFNCTGLTSVTIPNSVTSIGSFAFYNCSGLTSPVYNAHVFAYMPTSYSGAYTIPDGIESIAGAAFYECSLTSLTIPNSVTRIGDGAFDGCRGLTSVTIPNSVTSIGNYAFRGCSSLTSLTIPNSVTSIGNEAFAGCTGLTSVTIPNSVTSIGDWAFQSCTGLTSVTIGNSVTSIGDNAFYDCTGLTSITCEAITPPTLSSYVFSAVNTSIPLYVPAGSVSAYQSADQWKDFTNILPIHETPGTCITASGTCGAQGDNLTWELSCDSVLTISGTGEMANYSNVLSAPWYSYNSSIQYVVIGNNVTSIGDYAFYNCSGLTSVTIPNSVTSIGDLAFYFCTGLTSVTIGNSVTSIGDYAFYDCTSLTSVTIGNSVTSIGNSAFEGCSGLTSVTIPNSVTSIGNSAFEGCSGLTSVTIPNSVTSIGNSAFEGCSGLTSVTIPNSVTSIGNYAFRGCSSLTSINVAFDNSNYCSVDGVLFNKDKTTLIQYPGGKQGAYTIPNSVTSIGDRAFDGCIGLTSVTIPNSVTSIGYGAFYFCTGLTSVTIPNSVTSIGDNAFAYCTGLTSVTIGNSVTSIGNSAFEGCSGLTSVTIPNSVTSIGDYAFGGCSGLTSVTNFANTPQEIDSYVFDNVDKSTCVLYVPAGSISAYQSADQWKDFTNILPIHETPGTCITASGTCGAQGDNLTWELSCDSVLTISGTGEMANYSNVLSAPWYSYNSSIQYVVIGNNVTSIGDYAFYNCSGLTSVTIPNSVTSIGNSAFEGCSGLTSVTIPNSVTSIGRYAFASCSGLTSVTIPNSVTSIGDRAFEGCIGLTSVTIPNSVTSIGNEAFAGCTGLTSVTIPNSVTSIGSSAFSGCTGLTSVTIPNSVTSIGSSAFSGCSGLTSVTIPNSVTSIGSSAFSGCTGLTSVTIPNSITSIGKFAFSGCTSLTSVTIPNSVTSIGDKAFYGCSGLTSIEIPNSVTSIGNYAFSGCTGLISVTIPNSVTSIGNSAFSGCSSLTSVTIPNSITSIGEKAFYNCTGLTSVTIPNSVASIGDGAFRNCSGLTSVTIPNSVTSIEDYAFYGCSGLTSVTIPNSVTSIGNRAFYNCSNLIHVVCSPIVPPALNDYIFNTSSMTIEVPCGSAAAYTSAPYWYKSNKWQIVEFDYKLYEINFEVSDTALGHIEILEEWNCAQGYAKAKVVTNHKVRFNGWSNGASEQIYTLYPTSDTTVVANLVEDDTPFTITVTADENMGTVSGSGTYYYGDEIIISATAKDGYAFRSWSDGNMLNPRRLPYADYNLEAVFGEPKIMNSEGTDFWMTFLRASENDRGPEELSLTFSALEPCVVSVENPYMGWREQYVLAAGVPRRVTLDKAFCYSIETDRVLHTALHITSTENVSIFAANYRTKSFDVANILPCSDLNDEYYIQTYPASDHEGKPQGSHFAIIAVEDGETIIDYHLTTATESGKTGDQTVTLKKGQVWYVWTGNNDGYASDLSGSHVKARDGKKIAVFQGAPHTNIPYKVRDRDHLYSQAVPVDSWGNEFVVPSSLHHKRDIIRVMAQTDGTEVYVNNQLVHTFDFINGDENDKKRTFEFELGESNVTGDIGEREIVQLPEPLVVDSSCYITTSAPATVHLFMTSNRYDNYSTYSDERGINDPAMLYIAPVEQMVKEACFSTYSTPQINLHYINIIARADAIGDIALKGNGELRALTNEFRLVNSNPKYAFARVQIQKDVYTLSGSKGFIAYVYGFGERESYAFSVGGKSVYQVPKMKLILGCDSIMGSVHGSGEYEFNEIVKISATANEGYEFVHWTDGDENATRQIVMTDDKELGALFREIGKEPVDTVEVTPTSNSADIHWPEVAFAYSYCITIWLDMSHAQYYCKLYFNAYGILIYIEYYQGSANYIPRRAPYQLAESNVQFDFSLYGLNPETTYYYTITAYDEVGNELDNTEGEFVTLAETVTGINNTPFPSGEGRGEALKLLHNGQIFILRGDRTYTLTGQEVK